MADFFQGTLMLDLARSSPQKTQNRKITEESDSILSTENNTENYDRKLSCIVWHLEVAGSWKKLKGVLVDVRYFQYWWADQNRDEFINLWASLTMHSRYASGSLVTGIFDVKSMHHNQQQRPCYDPVEDYTKNFLIEFASLGHEEEECPAFHHPCLEKEELFALGVPHIDREDDTH
eukprot:1673366-Ditylum_brightwellii.AAC.1